MSENNFMSLFFPEDFVKKIEITEFWGLNTEDDPTAISEKESPYMLNMDIVKKGKLMTKDSPTIGQSFVKFPSFKRLSRLM